MKFSIAMPYLPQVSINHAYGQRRGRRFLTKEAANWKIMLQIRARRAIERHNIKLPADGQIIIELAARFPRQRGRRPDGDNFLKLAQDAIAAAFEVDDHICLARVDSVQHNQTEPGLIYTIIIYNVR